MSDKKKKIEPNLTKLIDDLQGLEFGDLSSVLKEIDAIHATNQVARYGQIVDRLIGNKPVSLAALKEAFTGLPKFKPVDGTLRSDIKNFARLRYQILGPADLEPQPKMSEAELISMVAKREIANRLLALDIMKSDPSLAVSAGSTVALACELLAKKRRRLECYTYSALLFKAARIYDYFGVTLAGGKYFKQADAYVGTSVSEWFSKLTFAYGLLGTSGISISADGKSCHVYVKYCEETEILRKMIGSINVNLIILADVRKIGRTDVHKVASIPPADGEPKITLITNNMDAWKEMKHIGTVLGVPAMATHKKLREISTRHPDKFEYIEAERGSNKDFENDDSWAEERD